MIGKVFNSLTTHMFFQRRLNCDHLIDPSRYQQHPEIILDQHKFDTAEANSNSNSNSNGCYV